MEASIWDYFSHGLLGYVQMRPDLLLSSARHPLGGGSQVCGWVLEFRAPPPRCLHTGAEGAEELFCLFLG